MTVAWLAWEARALVLEWLALMALAVTIWLVVVVALALAGLVLAPLIFANGLILASEARR